MGKKIVISSIVSLGIIISIVFVIESIKPEELSINDSGLEYYQLREPGSTVYHAVVDLDNDSGVSLSLAVEVIDNVVINYEYNIINSKSNFPFKTDDENIVNMQNDVLRVEQFINDNARLPELGELDLTTLNLSDFKSCYEQIELPQGVTYDKDSIRKYHG